MKNVLIRAWSKDFSRNYGNVVVAELLERRVMTHVPILPGQIGRGSVGRDFPGAVLIDSGEALGPIAEAIRRGHDFLITIAATDVYIWKPVAANMSIADYWTVECVPWVEMARACAIPDSEILKAAHDDN